MFGINGGTGEECNKNVYEAFSREIGREGR